MEDAVSKSGRLIRLPAERWQHIIAEHEELQGLYLGVLRTISEPNYIFAGTSGELVAVRHLSFKKWLVVIYREMEDDGFVITAFLTKRKQWFKRREQLWP